MTSRAVILAEAKRLAAGEAAAAAGAALARDDFDGACTALLAGLVKAEVPEPALVGKVLRGVDDPILICALVGRLGPGAVDAVCTALEAGGLTTVQEATLLFCAVQALVGQKVPPRLLTRLRLRARMPLPKEDAPLFAAAVAQLADQDPDARAQLAVEPAPSKEVRARAEEAKQWMTGPLEKALPEEPLLGPPLPGARKAEKVPRNAPCPCGSGKKYKACHGGAEVAPAPVALGLDAQLKAASPELLPQHVDSLRLGELLRLDFAAMTTPALAVAYDRLCAMGRLEVAERAAGVLVGRGDLGRARPDDYRLDLLLYALEHGDAALADRQRAALEDPSRWDELHGLERAWLDGDVGVARLEAVATAALGSADEAMVRELAWVLVRRAPSLGVLAARGALPTAGKLDARELLYAAQEARDRALLPSSEPGWGVFDALFPDSDRATDTAEERDALDRRAHELTRKLEDSQRRLTDAEGRLHALTSTSAGAAAGEDEDKGQLKQKVTELKDLLKEGNRERAELRRTLQHVTEQLSDQEQAAPAPAVAEDAEEPEEGDGLEAPRGVLAPAFARAAVDALDRLPRNIARDAVLRVSEVAAGLPTAWREVKRMQHVPGYFSVRVGIHHRVLFHLEGPTLVVDEVIHRQDLDATIRRLGR